MMIRDDAGIAPAVTAWAARVKTASPSPALPADHAVALRTGPRATHQFTIPVAAEFSAAPPRNDLQSTLVLAAFSVLLHRYSTQDRMLIAYGPAAALMLLSIDVSGNPTFSALVQRVAQERNVRSTDPAVPSFALFDNSETRDLPLIAHAAFHVAAPTALRDSESVPVDVSLTYAPDAGDGLPLCIDYRADRYEPATIERFAGHLGVLLHAALRDPACEITGLPLLTAAERAEQQRWNATAAHYPATCSLVDLLRKQANRTPDALALQYEDATLTYAELDERANRLGSYLRARGIGPEVRVAVCIERSLDMLVAVLGVQRVGGAYVPIDPEYPSDRIGFMLSDSGARAIVIHEAVRSRLPPGGALVVSLDGERDAIACAAPTPPQIEAGPEQLAYVIYTSGSTGRPKGVQIEHRNVVNFASGMQRSLGMKPGDRFVSVASLAFDMSELDIYLSLLYGARLILASRETAVNPKALAALIQRTAATHVQATPSMWRMLIEAGWQGGSDVTILSGGEALPQHVADGLVTRARAVWNLYGPTEATVYATVQRIRAGEDVTIGRPMPNVSTYVLDARLQPVPVGISGELYIGGHGIARGYLNRPELSAERFIADPFSTMPDARMYRTGDVARFRAEGSLEFLGRADFQVKLRGYRIELGEIETALCACTGVGGAVVIVREDAPGVQRLVAYVTHDAEVTIHPIELRRRLLERVPRYMVPETIVALDTLPLNANGKVDRTRLPVPERVVDRASSESVLVPPGTPLEAQLAAIWEDVLDVRPIGATDDFFELGVSSITAARLFDRIEREIGAKLPLSPLFAAPTVRKLAALIESGDGRRRATSLVPIQPLGSKTPIFCVHGGAGTILHFQPLAKRLGETQPFYGLQMKGLYGDAAPHLNVEAMARHYVREIKTVQLAGPFVLAGYCFGGIVAFEMARQLELRGERVTLLILLNAATPAYVRTHGPVWFNPSVERPKKNRLDRIRHAIVGLHPTRLRYRFKPRRRLAKLRDSIVAALGFAIPSSRREEVFTAICSTATKRYRPKTFAGSALIVSGAGLFTEPTLGWRAHLTANVATVEVPGRHTFERDTMLEPYVAFLAERLREALARSTSP